MLGCHFIWSHFGGPPPPGASMPVYVWCASFPSTHLFQFCCFVCVRILCACIWAYCLSNYLPLGIKFMASVLLSRLWFSASHKFPSCDGTALTHPFSQRRTPIPPPPPGPGRRRYAGVSPAVLPGAGHKGSASSTSQKCPAFADAKHLEGENWCHRCKRKLWGLI